MLVQSNHQKNSNKPNVEAEIARYREQEEVLKKKCEDLQKRINKLESDNKELALCW
jgi:chaperonin cofactor prefoldin